MYSPVEEFLDKFLFDISLVCEDLAVKFLGEDGPHPFVPVIDVRSRETEGYDCCTAGAAWP